MPQAGLAVLGRSTASAPVAPNPAVLPCHAVVIAGPKNGMRCRSRVATSTAGVITGTNANTDDACLAIAAELSAATPWSTSVPAYSMSRPATPPREFSREKRACAPTSAPVVDASPVTMPATVIDERVTPGASASVAASASAMPGTPAQAATSAAIASLLG